MSFAGRPLRLGIGDDANTGSRAMQYLLMIYRSEADLGKMTAADRKAMTAEYMTYTQSIVQSGHFKAGDGLQPPTPGAPAPRGGGEGMTTAGPVRAEPQ